MNLTNKLKKATMLLIVSMVAMVSYAQKTVSGVVKDANGEPLVGVSVTIKGSTKGVVTDIDGKYQLPNAKPNDVLSFSYIGYDTKEVKVGSKTNFEVVLAEDDKALEEVVVIGYQTIKKKDLTGSVASINTKDLTVTPVDNVAQALQGKLPGVNITSQDGRPDASISIRVRGGGSVSQSNDPLILVDGVPGTLSDIPADQIDRIDVLKDASSTAIYGARGANGVILITTKGAKEGKAVVSYNGYAKWNTPTKYLETLSPYDYLAFVWGNAAANGSAYEDSFVKLYGLDKEGGINNYRNVEALELQKDVYGASFSHNHDLSVSGGSKDTKIFFGVNYSDNEGMKKNSYFDRANVNLKVNQKIRKNVDFGVDVRYTQVSFMGDESTTSGKGSLLSRSYRFRPIPMWAIEQYGNVDALHEGNIDMFGKGCQWDSRSPLAMINDYENVRKRQALRGNANLNWEIIKGLNFRTELFLGRTWNQNTTWAGPTYSEYLDEKTGEVLWAGAASVTKGDSWNTRWTNTLAYNFELNKIHNFNVLVGQEITNSNGNSMTIKADHFPANFTKDNAFAMINQYDSKNLTEKTPFSTSWNTPERILSYFGRLNYTLMDRYLFTFTMRADGSSKFAPANRWGYFPAAAFAWRVSEEQFMAGTQDWLNNLKLRLSFGTSGNDGISSNLWSSLWKSDTSAAFGNAAHPAYTTDDTMANPNLKWETTITRNLGFDFGFLNNRITATIDYYWNTTKDLLMLTELPGNAGYTKTYDNIGQTSNRGLEIGVQGTIYQDKDFSISAGANINFNKNKVDKLAEGMTGFYGSHWIQSGSPNNDYRLVEGKAVGQLYGYIYDGFYTTADFNYENGIYTLKEGVTDVTASIFGAWHDAKASKMVPKGQGAYPGMPKFRNTTEGDNVITEEDKVIIGDTNPDCTGGFNITATYKGFDLGAYFNWSIGNDVYNVNKLATLYGYKESGVYENKLAIIKDCYKVYDIVNGKLEYLDTPEKLNAANANASLPTPYNEAGLVSSLGVEDGSYLRLNTLTLGYTLPKPVLNKIGLSHLRVYASCYNLFTITSYSGLDPEVNANNKAGSKTYPTTGLDWGTYPRARSFVLGVNLKF